MSLSSMLRGLLSGAQGFRRGVLIDENGWYYEEYRRDYDPQNLRRIRQSRPNGLGNAVATFSKVAGISKGESRHNAEAMSRASYLWLELERAPFEGHPNAIKVMGKWRDTDGTERRGQVGWVPSDLAERIAVEIPGEPLSAALVAVYQQTKGKNVGMRMDIFAPYTRICPYCSFRFKKAPKRKTDCMQCGKPCLVRASQTRYISSLLTEEQARKLGV